METTPKPVCVGHLRLTRLRSFFPPAPPFCPNAESVLISTQRVIVSFPDLLREHAALLCRTLVSSLNAILANEQQAALHGGGGLFGDDGTSMAMARAEAMNTIAECIHMVNDEDAGPVRTLLIPLLASWYGAGDEFVDTLQEVVGIHSALAHHGVTPDLWPLFQQLLG